MSEIVAVLGLFMLRIGAPVLLLVGLGILIDRWQRKREQELRHQLDVQLEDYDEADEEIRKVA